MNNLGFNPVIVNVMLYIQSFSFISSCKVLLSLYNNNNNDDDIRNIWKNDNMWIKRSNDCGLLKNFSSFLKKNYWGTVDLTLN